MLLSEVLFDISVQSKRKLNPIIEFIRPCYMSIVSIHLNNKNVIHVMIYFTTLQDVLPQIQIWSFITELVTITNN